MELPEIVYQAAFAPDLSEEGPWASIANKESMTRERRIRESREGAFVHLVGRIAQHGAAAVYQRILQYIRNALGITPANQL